MSVFSRIFWGGSMGLLVLAVGLGASCAWSAEAENEQPGATASESAEHASGAERAAGDAEHGTEHEGEEAHHDEYDLSHANASAKLERPDEWRFDMAICTFVVFLLLLTLLRAFAWKPILEGLDKREQAIRGRIEQAERTAQKASAQLRAYEAKMAAAADEAAQLIEKARRDAEALAEKIRTAAQEDAQRERQRAVADIREAKNTALTEVSREAANLAVLLAGKIVRRELNADEHARLIAEALENLPSNN